MKKFLLLFIFNSIIFSQPELKIVRALPHLYNVTHVPASSIFFAGGENGAILKSTDNGNTWFGTFSVLQNTVTSLYFINENTGWAVTAYGKVAKTNNSGVNWEMAAEISNAPFRDIAFVNESIGYAAGANVIYKSIDGGYTWNESFNNNSVFIQRISVPSVNNCWVVCNEGYMFRTTNGGINWTEIVSGTSGNIMAVHFVNTQTGWYTGSNFNSTRKTTNGGISWEFIPVGFPGPWNVIKFFNDNNGYIGGAKVGFTFDGGQNWIFNNPYSNWIMNSTSFKDMNTGVSVSGYGLITSTSNSGQNWTIEQFGHNGILKSIYFSEDIFGWALYDNSLIVQTTDRGTTWNENTALLGTEAKDLFFFNRNTGWACTYSGKFYKTTNGGFNWNVMADLGEFNDFEKIYFINNNKGFSYRAPGLLYITINGGTMWNLIYTFTAAITNFKFANENTGWITGMQGMIYKTTNSGTIWQSQSNGISGNIMAISIIDANTAYAGGTKLYKTVNGGINWNIFNNDNSAGFKELFFNGTNTAWGVDTTGLIVYTSNSGVNWIQYPTPYLMNFWCANSNNNVCWFGGNFGTIVTNSQIVPVNILNSEIPDKYNFRQNYPNPFNPSTKFEFEIPEKEFIELKIFDITGKIVEILISKILEPGTYSADFNGNKLSTGIYFAVLKSSVVTYAKKIILLK